MENFPGVKVCPVASYEKKDEQELLKVTIGKKKKKKKMGKLRYWPAGMIGFLKTIASFGIVKNGKVVEVNYAPPHLLRSDWLSRFAISTNIDSASTATGPGGEELAPIENLSTEGDENGEDDEDETDEEEDEEEAGEETEEEYEASDVPNEPDMEDDHYAPLKEVDYLTITTVGNPNVGKSTFVRSKPPPHPSQVFPYPLQSLIH